MYSTVHSTEMVMNGRRIRSVWFYMACGYGPRTGVQKTIA